MPVERVTSSASTRCYRHPSRRRIVGVSLKMYFDYARTQTYARGLLQCANMHPNFPIADHQGTQALDIFVLPDFASLQSVQETLSRSTTHWWIGAQNVCEYERGAYTGEVAASTLAQVGCRLVELGHAERRHLFNETDEIVARKAVQCVRYGLIPLVCVGERTCTSDTLLAVDECWHQVAPVLVNVPHDAPICLAYEPVWAIGKEEPATPEHIRAVTQALRSRCLAEFPERHDVSLRIIYGGSAKLGLYSKISDVVDGLFLGRYGHDPATFIDTVWEVYKADNI